MERLINETGGTFLALTLVTCLAVGAGGAFFFTLGPEGWLTELIRALLRDPNLSTLAALAAAIGALSLARRLLDRHAASAILNNLLAGAVGLGGFVIILQGVRSVIS